MEFKDVLLSYLKQPTTFIYSDPNQSNICPLSLFLQDPY